MTADLPGNRPAGSVPAPVMHLPGTEMLVRKLALHEPLAEDELHALRAARLQPRRVRAGEDLLQQGVVPSACLLLLRGMAFRYKMLDGGRRQILSFGLPGDLMNLDGLVLGHADHGLGAAAPSSVAWLPFATLQDWAERHPRLGRVLWRETLVEAAILREWVANVGRRSAYERVAHLFCEIVTRLRRLDLGRDVFDLPMRQAELADATGLSQVHVNRTIQALRRDGLIRWAGRTLIVPDWDRLVLAAGFEAGYLHGIAA